MRRSLLVDECWSGLRAHFLEKCSESSQDIARRLFRGDPVLVVCGEIAGARGRLGRKWHAPPGGLWFTLAVDAGDLERSTLLSLAAGVAVAKAVRSVVGLEARLKWPNDVLVGERKVAGVLVEIAQLGARYALLVGVGVNANNELPPELGSSAASLKQLAGSEVDAQLLLGEILRLLHRYYLDVELGNVNAVLSEWRELSATLGRKVRVLMPGGLEVRGTAVDIDERGRLVVEAESGRVCVDAGDVEHLRFS